MADVIAELKALRLHGMAATWAELGEQRNAEVERSRWLLYFSALPSRLLHTWRIMFSSASTMGIGEMRHSPRSARPSLASFASSMARASATSDCMSTACRRRALRPRRL